MIIKASGQFEAASDITSQAGMTILFGVVVMLVGTLFATLSGFGQEKLEKAEGKTKEKSGGFAFGLIMVVIAGVLSAGWGFAFVYSQGPIIEAMKDHGASDFPAGIAVWAFVLFGAVFVNVLYPVFLISRKKSWNVLSTSPKDIGLSVTFRVLFFSASVLMANGMLRLGALYQIAFKVLHIFNRPPSATPCPPLQGDARRTGGGISYNHCYCICLNATWYGRAL
jgi:hypothetical protein